MPDTLIESVLTGKLDTGLLLKWLNDDNFEDLSGDCVLTCCNRNEFVAYFLSYLRNQTNSILQTNSNAPPPLHQTPEKVHDSRRKHRRSISDPTNDDRKDSLSVKSQSQRSQESPSKDRKKGRRVKAKLFPEDKNLSISSDESRLSFGIDRVAISSTPMKNGLKLTDYPSLVSPVTPKSFKDYERCDTPRLSHRHRSHEKSCLGDYLVTAQKSSKKKKGRNASDDSEPKIELDLSNSDAFPEIGARKSSSLRSEKKRIKPTNIDKSTSQKSLSLSSFNSDCFQQPSPLALQENVAFKQQSLQPKESSNSFDAERSMLKLERHKLMEKFNILNTASSPKPATPQIKITHKDSLEKAQSFVKSDASKIVFRDKIDSLVDIYEVLLNNNLILSINTEIYFLISIIISKQCEDDYNTVESKLKENNFEYLLKSIHNSTYFAVKSLWCLRTVLEVILDKNSLKILGENKKVRAFYPELAKFLLNSYGLKCESENGQEKKTVETRGSNGVVCFNHETDNVDNFPSVLSFQNFKKQRDMFYEIVRWYGERQAGGGLRARVKALLSSAPAAANYAHLAALLARHMLAGLPPATQESKLSKLQRRLTCPTSSESHRLPHFTAKEMFYKEFISCTENEPFRVHVRDVLCAEIVSLDAVPLGGDDRTNANSWEVSKQFQLASKKLCVAAKLVGWASCLPYGAEPARAPPTKHALLENALATRNYSQPTIDLKGMLMSAYENSRLIVTLPWMVHYLSMLDYTTLRLNYYQDLIKILNHIYVNRLKTDGFLKKNTVIFLKCILGWLFDLPHFPQVLCEKSSAISVSSVINIDCYDVIDETILFDLCPYLRDVNILLSTCKVNHEQKDMGSFRHITPVSLSLNPEDRIRSKEKELQARLEEEMLRSLPSSSRRVLELVTERVAAAAVRDLHRPLAHARHLARHRATRLLASRGATTHTHASLLQSLQALYAEELSSLRAAALEVSRAAVRRRSAAALQALLSAPPAPLQALAANTCLQKLAKWLNEHWTDTAILCKDIEEEMKSLIALGDTPTLAAPKSPVVLDAMTLPSPDFEEANVSPAMCIIDVKEYICVMLEGGSPAPPGSLLARCAASCRPHNVFTRPPTLRAILQLTIDLCIVYVSRNPKDINEVFLNQLHIVWNTCCPDRKRSPPQDISLPERRPDLSPNLRNFEDERAPTPVSDDEIQTPTKIIILNDVNISESDVKNSANFNSDVKSLENDSDVKISDKSAANVEERSEYLEYFDRVLCPRNVVLLSSTKSDASDVWEALATVLVFLLKNDYLSEDSLTEQCLAVYRQDWPQTILENLSKCMKSVSSRWSRSATGKFTLFLDFLAEYCGDMDYEPMD